LASVAHRTPLSIRDRKITLFTKAKVETLFGGLAEAVNGSSGVKIEGEEALVIGRDLCGSHEGNDVTSQPRDISVF
jgi:hypothetical protein